MSPAPDEPRPVAGGSSLMEIIGLTTLAAVGGLVGLALISGSCTRTMGASRSAHLQWQERQQAIERSLADPENRALREKLGDREAER